MHSLDQPVLILGAGINGCALARELALNGVSVWIVDTDDVAAGATSGSSRLIHGGLRYLEYGDFELVRESLAERARLLRLAPQFVRPLELWIPVENRFGGVFAAPGRFFGWQFWPRSNRPRGLWLINMGLVLYDAFARDPLLPKHRSLHASSSQAPPVNRDRYRWLSAYYDAQVEFPERLALAMLSDAESISRSVGLNFRVLAHHEARRRGTTVEIAPVGSSVSAYSLHPPIIINATGAWVDETLTQLDVRSRQLMGGTKGSHLFTFHPQLRAALGNRGIYAEARDGRPVFITPLGSAVLIGTTDEPFRQSPGLAQASESEVEYLLDAVNGVVNEVRLTRADVDFHYSAVRPLPRSDAQTPGAISRRHALVMADAGGVPLLSLVGGKLTTMRSLAETAAAEVLKIFGQSLSANSRQRPFPGAEAYPPTAEALRLAQQTIAQRTGFAEDVVSQVWALFGTRTDEVLASSADRALLDGLPLASCVARWAIRREWARTLADLVERRLMLLYHQRLSRRCLEQLAEILSDEGHVPPEHIAQAVDDEIERLATRYGKRVTSSANSGSTYTMAEKYILALDQGTTSSRAIVFSRDGQMVAVAQQEFEQILPTPGHVEHDPEAIWSSQLATARQALQRAGLRAADIAAIGITNQRETTILWEKATGRPVANAIVWQSRITAGICDRLKADDLEGVFRSKTGLVVDAYFSATKIKHLLDTVPGLRARAEAGEILFGTVDSWLIWRLTGGQRHVTDYSNASRTLIYNIHELDWDDELLRLLHIPRIMLPEVVPSSGVLGETDAQWFGGAIPIAGCAGDQQAATFGQACFEPGSAKNTYGTGCFLLLNTGHEAVTSQNKLLTTIGWGLDGKITYCLEGSVFIGGAVVQWLRDGLGIIKKSVDVEALAASVSQSEGVYLVPAFVGLGAPYWDPYARGTIVGITRGTTAAHIALAALESMAFQSRDLLEAMQRDAGVRLKALKVDGGAAVNNRLMQFQADILATTVSRPKVAETTALGAAYLAGLAVGYWSSQDEIAKNWVLDREFHPAMPEAERNARYGRWQDAVKRALAWEKP
jgi:glycerol kinase